MRMREIYHAAIRWYTLEDTAEEKMAASRAVDTMDAREAGSRFGRGNVSLQLRSFQTPAELVLEREEVAKLVFPPLPR